MLFDLAQRNRVKLAYDSVEAVRNAYSFSRLQDFLDIYYAGTAVLRTERDFHELALAYFRRARADNVRHVEAFFDPQAHTERGIPIDEGVRAAIEEFVREHPEIAVAPENLLDLIFRDIPEAEAPLGGGDEIGRTRRDASGAPSWDASSGAPV